MRKYTVLIALSLMFRLGATAQAFVIPNPTGNNDATQLGCDYYQLTPNVSFQQGAIWYTHQLDLNTAFDYTFDIYLGAANAAGADGMTFIIQNQGQGLGPQGTFGSQLGYGSFPGKSLAVEYDTHNNGPGAPYGDILQDHIAIDTGGLQFPPAAGPIAALASGAFIDDGNWHTTEIVWAPATQTMTIYFDGAQRLTCTFTNGLVASVFNNQNLLYWGWSGAGGSRFNIQQIRVPLQANFVAANNYAQCGLNNVLFTDSSVSGLNSLTWLWNFADGTTATTQDASHNYTSPASYNVKLTVTDGGGCSVDTVIPVNVYTVPVITPTHTDVTCFGLANGTAHAAVTGGTPAYNYTWIPAVSTVSSASALPPGTYGLIVTDQHGCADTTAYIITQPTALTNSFAQVNVLCFGDSTGSLISSPSGGTPGYTYTWNPAVGIDSAALDLAGNKTYNLTVTDANGCTVTGAATITQPASPLTVTLTTTNVLCYGTSTGSVTVNASGGTPAYTYNWNPNVATGNAATNIPAGNYVVTITDANGCSLTKDTSVTQPNSPLAFTTANAIPVLCYGYPTGTIIALANGGTPGYSYSLSTAGVTLVNDSGEFHDLLPLTYTLTVTDQKSCPIDTTLTVNQPAQLVIDSIPTASPTCYDYRNGKIKVAASGGTPGYNYQFSNGIRDTTGLDNNLPAGTYGITVTDNSGCTASDSSITLTQPDSVLIEVTPTPIQVILGDQLQLGTTSNQNGTVTYSWSPDFGLSCYDCPDPVFNGVFSQPYNVLATNQDGCVGSFAFTVTVVPEYNLFFPNAFLPAGSGANHVWQVFGKTNAVLEFHVEVFDRIGEKVFESNSVNYQWDGTFQGKPAPMGVYTYLSRVVWLNDYTSKLFEGTITLIR